MKRRILIGVVSAAVIAMAFTVGTFGRGYILNANAQTANLEKINKPAVTQTNTGAMNDKVPASELQQIDVSVDMEVEKGDQQNADKGSSPWKLDPVFVAQVFTSLQVSPDGIQGDYPVKLEELKLTKNTDSEAVVEVNSSKTNINKVYLKRLIRQDKTGIWTVVGYDKES